MRQETVRRRSQQRILVGSLPVVVNKSRFIFFILRKHETRPLCCKKKTSVRASNWTTDIDQNQQCEWDTEAQLLAKQRPRQAPTVQWRPWNTVINRHVPEVPLSPAVSCHCSNTAAQLRHSSLCYFLFVVRKLLWKMPVLMIKTVSHTMPPWIWELFEFDV